MKFEDRIPNMLRVFVIYINIEMQLLATIQLFSMFIKLSVLLKSAKQRVEWKFHQPSTGNPLEWHFAWQKNKNRRLDLWGKGSAKPIPRRAGTWDHGPFKMIVNHRKWGMSSGSGVSMCIPDTPCRVYIYINIFTNMSYSYDKCK